MLERLLDLDTLSDESVEALLKHSQLGPMILERKEFFESMGDRIASLKADSFMDLMMSKYIKGLLVAALFEHRTGVVWSDYENAFSIDSRFAGGKYGLVELKQMVAVLEAASINDLYREFVRENL